MIAKYFNYDQASDIFFHIKNIIMLMKIPVGAFTLHTNEKRRGAKLSKTDLKRYFNAIILYTIH